MKFKKLSAMMLTGVMAASLALPAYAKNSFSDVNEKHWAYSSVTWAANKGIAQGDGSGKFLPNQLITEAEFLAMLIRAFGIEPKPWSEDDAWFDKYYIFAKELKWPVKGYYNHNEANKTIDRQRVADIVSAADGENYLVIPWGTFGEDATIRYLLTKGYSNGITSATVEGYQAGKPLTRAEAVTFIKNLQDKGMTELKAKPEEESLDIAIVNERTRKVAEAVRAYIKDKPEYADVELSVPEDYTMALSLKEPDGSYTQHKLIVYLDEVQQSSPGIHMYHATERKYTEVAAIILKAMGIPVKDDFVDKVVKQNDQNKGLNVRSLVVRYGDYVVDIIPDYFNYDEMHLYFMTYKEWKGINDLYGDNPYNKQDVDWE